MSKPTKNDIQHSHHTPQAPYNDIRSDPYAYKAKPQPAICSDCQVVFHQGHWKWEAAPKQAVQIVCPACQRIKDNLPAGYVELSGEFLEQHKEDILNLMKNEAEYARSKHPLHRIMEIRQQNGIVTITTTDVHLARRLGDAVKNAYKGELQLNYQEAKSLMRVTWCR